MINFQDRLGPAWPVILIGFLLFISIISIILVASLTNNQVAAQFVRDNYVPISLFFGVATMLVLFSIEYILAQRSSATSVLASADGKMSISKTQTWWWTLAVVGGYVAVFVAGYIQLASRGEPTAPPSLNSDLWLVLGISAANVVAARAIVVQQIQAGQRRDTESDPKTKQRLRFQDLVMGAGDRIDIYKLQLVTWTLVAICIFSLQVVRRVVEMDALITAAVNQRAASDLSALGATSPVEKSKDAQAQEAGAPIAAAVSLPSIGAELLLLMGISQATYLGGKLVTEPAKFMVVLAYAGWPTAETDPARMREILIVNANRADDSEQGKQVLSGWKLALLPGGNREAMPKAVFPLPVPPDKETLTLRGGQQLIVKWTTDVVSTSDPLVWQVAANPPEPGDALVLRDVTDVEIDGVALTPPLEPAVVG
ncbi:MAG: hypothetical protein JXB47_06545 [Anaerolineae bacterium]|nr:hypothetical protein [Anaerolineae bacterium]